MGGYGGGMGGYGGGYGGMGGGMGGMGGMMGQGGMGGMQGMGGFDPNDPNSMPGPPPSGWQKIMQGLSGIVQFFGKIAWLVDENSQALHFFMTALLQLLDRAGVLYGELARFVMRILGFKVPDRPKFPPGQGPPGMMGPGGNMVGPGRYCSPGHRGAL